MCSQTLDLQYPGTYLYWTNGYNLNNFTIYFDEAVVNTLIKTYTFSKLNTNYSNKTVINVLITS